MRSWKSIVVVAALAVASVAALAGVAGAVGSRQHLIPWHPMMAGSAGGQTARAGVCGRLMSDPAALKAMQTLRAEHLKDMQAWNDKYGVDPTSAEARKALQALRQDHWNDMRRLFEKYGIKVPDRGPGMMGGNGWTPGQGGGWGGCGGRGSAPPSSTASPGTSSYGPGMMGTGASL